MKFRTDRTFIPHTEAGLTPMQVGKAYNIPTGLDLSKRTVAILELGGAYNILDIILYCTRYGIKKPKLTSKFVDGALEIPDPTGADGEVCLDIDVIAGIAQGVHIVVVFAPNSDQGFIDGVKACMSVNPDAISISWGCYDDKTEVLTEAGWKLFADVQEFDKIATLVQDTHAIEYHPYIQKHVYPFNGKMHSFKNSKLDLLVTPNHNMYVRKCIKRNKPMAFEMIRADETIKNVSFVKSGTWLGQSQESVEIAGETFDMNLWLEFLGYFLSEGWATVGKAHHKERALSKTEKRFVGERIRDIEGKFALNTGDIYEKTSHYIAKAFDEVTHRIGISQKKAGNIEKIQACLDRLPFSFTRKVSNGCVQWSCSNKALTNLLTRFGKAHQKFIPQELLNLGKDQLKIFYDALMLGDGTRHEEGKTAYYTSSKRLADGFQELCLKLGFAADISVVDRVGRVNEKGTTRHVEYRLNIKERKTGTSSPKQDTEHYEGNVYCLTVPNHTMFVRRNGKAVWCGNSPEDSWTAEARTALDTLFLQCAEQGIAVFAAAGDNGSSDGEATGDHVDYPASSPYVVACGGTLLQLNPDGTRLSETAWATGGGGVSVKYPIQPYQVGTVPAFPIGRRVPDVSGNADPATGYTVMIDGFIQQVGGTSGVAPLMAANHVVMVEKFGAPLKNFPARFYDHPTAFFDVLEGDNGDYKAGTGFDLCTGLGVIDGAKFIEALTPVPTAPVAAVTNTEPV